MKLLSEFPEASMCMTASKQLQGLLEYNMEKEEITHVLETGTYLGLGSTTFVAESFRDTNPPQLFVTIEANWVSWCHAKRNLERFPFAMPLWGKTVDVDRAMRFIETDDALRSHNEYPDLFIDDTKDPIRFYSDEILGSLGGRIKHPWYFLRQLYDRAFSYAGDNLLEKHLQEFRSRNPLIILDSAGGIGLLEFSILEKTMRDYHYLLLLDDINHLKHFRSYQHIRDNQQFALIGVDEREGWLFTKHSP